MVQRKGLKDRIQRIFIRSDLQQKAFNGRFAFVKVLESDSFIG